MAAFSFNGIHLFDDQFLVFGIKGFIHRYINFSVIELVDLKRESA